MPYYSCNFAPQIVQAFMGIQACILNLDGVVVDTARYHYQAWRQLANKLGFDITEAQHETLRGRTRMESMERVLEWGHVYMSEAEKLHWADVKNNWYLAALLQMQSDEVLPGVLPFLDQIQAAGLRIALASGSKNAAAVVHLLKLDRYFELIMDSNSYRKPKPDPECFQLTAKAFQLRPEACLVFEDMPSGIFAARYGNFPVVGVGRKADLSSADLVIDNFVGLHLASLLKHFNPRISQTV